MLNDDSQSPKNAVAAIRVSSVKQGTQGDSPDAQKEQIERYAQSRNIRIKKFFVFLESASKEQQPMQEVIDYCGDAKNGIDIFIIKSIDRFTRGGSYSYDHLKLQLDKFNVALVDIYGVISSQKVNTLEHLGVSYNWSVYSPTQKAEILEAERAKDEMRDIMSRMIGAQIRYARMGYWIRQAPYGYQTERVETGNGKRCILKPHPDEADFIKKMFELRIKGTLDDREIVQKINKLGYKSRVTLLRDKTDRSKIIGQRGGLPLTLKTFWRTIQNPVYAAIRQEKWHQGAAVKMHFDGLVTIDQFNKANRGKVAIEERDGKIVINKKAPAEHLVKKGVRNPDFPYKRVVMCSECAKPLYGSASRGRLGKYYPAYHCNKRGHYFRVPKAEFESTIAHFVKSICVAPEKIDELEQAVIDQWQKRQASSEQETQAIDERIKQLESSNELIIDKIKFLSSETAIKRMEEEVLANEKKIKDLEDEKQQAETKKPQDMRHIMKYVRYFLEHLEELLLQQMNPVARANYFSVIFDKNPTYEEIVSGTKDITKITGVNELFLALSNDSGNVAGVEGFEPPNARTKTWCLTTWPHPIVR